MQSLWNDAEAAGFADDLALRVYTSRLLGRDRSLVLHGGGNTSVKLRERDIFGAERDVLYVKGSGWDLETIEAAGFAPVRLDHAARLAQLPALSDPEMVNQLATCMTRAGAPAPSVETILHACLPAKFVDHTHADAVLAVSDTADGEARLCEIYGERCVVIPYLMPGFDLARHCALAFAQQAKPGTIGMVLHKHGIFSFGATARESYERMIELVGMAEAYLKQHKAWSVARTSDAAATAGPLAQALLRRQVSDAAGAPMVLRTVSTPRTLGYARRTDIAAISQRGPVTPDHVIRTKRIPLLGGDVPAYAEAYGEWFRRHEPQAKDRKTMLDPAPRAALDPAYGLAAIGRTAKDATIVEDLFEHTMDVVQSAEVLGGYEPLPERDLFDMEYWDLEQAKLKKGGKPPAFTGEVVLITGAASGIGRAAVDAFLARGAAVIALDRNPAVEGLLKRADYLGMACDLTNEPAVGTAIRRGVLAYGGVDMLVLNAGIFPPSRRIAELATDEWRRTMDINLDANLALLRMLHPFLRLAPRGGRVAVVGSKNVPAPGPGAAAYSASKAALNQLVRVAALEWAADNIRLNSLHPNSVFDTGIWTPEVLAQRAKAYDMSIEQYKKRNLLRTEVASRDVAELAAELCGPLFAKTTGAQIAVDGGDDRVI
jgi:rhamnose utilization protein RhaD (predicted bifunctional aldolase and dehydrogenase)/NAD(P)-dependent dehydrogenase (short-subunit alcohol dehydrogenase family)